MGLPKRPVGRTSSTMISTANTMASASWVDTYALLMISMMPSSTPPSIAPGMEPMPPNTAATKAFRPGIPPEVIATVG